MDVTTFQTKDGTEYHVYFDVGAAREFKRSYGRSLHDVWILEDAHLEALDPDCLCHLLAAGLRHENEKISPDRVEKLLNKHIAAGGNLREIQLPTVKAIRKFFQGDPEEPGDETGKE
jgi:hypothetical protein